MNVLVTGGAGFIGSHLAEALLNAGHGVVVLDDLSNGIAANVPDGALFVQGDVRDSAAIGRAMGALGSTHAVCHLAGQASTFKSFAEPSWDMDVNGVGTGRVLECARERGVGTVLFASSMTAYGHPTALPVTEDQRCAPVSYYGATKWLAERACVIAATQDPWGPKVAAFRMFNVYGERQSLTNPYQGVLGIFLGRVLRDEPIRIFGDGEQTRDFVYVGDVAQAWLAALETEFTEPAVLNLGTGVETSVNELWRMAVQACGHDPSAWPVSYEDVRPGDQRRMAADISRARDVLGWTPATSLRDGLTRTARWARTAV